jgi:hypothetical protein
MPVASSSISPLVASLLIPSAYKNFTSNSNLTQDDDDDDFFARNTEDQAKYVEEAKPKAKDHPSVIRTPSSIAAFSVSALANRYEEKKAGSGMLLGSEPVREAANPVIALAPRSLARSLSSVPPSSPPPLRPSGKNPPARLSTLTRSPSSAVRSSFTGMEDNWFEFKVKEGLKKGEKYYFQPRTGTTLWTAPRGVNIQCGALIKLDLIPLAPFIGEANFENKAKFTYTRSFSLTYRFVPCRSFS